MNLHNRLWISAADGDWYPEIISRQKLFHRHTNLIWQGNILPWTGSGIIKPGIKRCERQTANL
jgi:hypothetical protein